MSEHRTPSCGSSSATSLLLKVLRPNGGLEEYYVARRMTIGRTDENTIVLDNDDTVDRTHAQTHFDPDGTVWLRGFEARDLITLDNGAQVGELRLVEGARFRIGGVQFECLAGKRQPARAALQSPSACPLCQSDDLPEGSAGVLQCPKCHGALLRVPASKAGDRDLVVPGQYGQYRADHFVARGGMGLVLKGRDEVNSRAVAIKLSQGPADPVSGTGSRFAQEISLLSQLSHPNVVRFLGFGHEAGFQYLVMEWVEGRSLRDVIAEYRQHGTLPEFFDVIRCLEQACEGLAAIHKLGIVHRDIKPPNILIGDDHKVRLTDLGVAKRLDALTTGLTSTGQAPGTWQYMAPEQIEAPDIVDRRADQYSLGVTFYELLVAKPPSGAWRPASSLNATVPAEFDALLSRLLAPNREDRFFCVEDEILPEVRRLRTALWSYRERHGVLLNYFEFTNHSHYPLSDVHVRAVIYDRAGGSRKLDVTLNCLSAGGTHRHRNAFERKEVGLFGFLGSEFACIEARMRCRQPPLRLIPPQPPGAPSPPESDRGTLVEIAIDPQLRQYEIQSRATLSQLLHGTRPRTDVNHLARRAGQWVARLSGPAFAKVLIAALACGLLGCAALAGGAGTIGGLFVFAMIVLAGILAAHCYSRKRPNHRPSIPEPDPTEHPRDWQVAIYGRKYGPYSLPQLCLIHAEGRLPAEALFWRPGISRWVYWTEVNAVVGNAPPQRSPSEPSGLSTTVVAGTDTIVRPTSGPVPTETSTFAGDKASKQKGGGASKPLPTWVTIAVAIIIARFVSHFVWPPVRPPPKPRVSLPGGPLRLVPRVLGERLPSVAQPIALVRTNSIGMKLKLVPAGSFWMGALSTDHEAADDESPRHLVQTTSPFYLGVYEVTQEQYASVMGGTPSEFKGSTRPVDSVTWDEAVEFCRRLSARPVEQRARLVYRLPTEGEWEYVCRAGYGADTLYSFGNDPSCLTEYAIFRANAPGSPQPVGQKKPNAWGFYDMHGNVWEWCADCFDPKAYATVDSHAFPTGDRRVLRGGAWCTSIPFMLRSSYRYCMGPQERHYGNGFRVAASIVP